MSERALVLFSGGQDSATCLAWALDKFDAVETIGFDYRQRHRTELECRGVILEKFHALFSKWGAKLGEDHMVDLASLHAISETALTRDAEIKLGEDGLPNTFVPGRNLLFFTYAAALAYRRGIRHLVGGMCETDYSGYPDCRAATLKTLQEALNLGMERDFTIHAPLMHIDKAASWRLAENLGGDALVGLIREETHTCYLGQRGKKHEWGFGCGRCPACNLRREGYVRYWESKTAQEEAHG